ncbi:MAG: hypothetical protein H0W83_12055, partial [Planctomycetes bacterium]|nr:hypothetical protein [Planctomycetota bacterium]
MSDHVDRVARRFATMPSSIVALAIAYACGAAPMAAETIAIDPEAPVCASFLGFGAEWDPKFWTMGTFDFLHDVTEPVAVTEADWDLVRKRMRWMRIKIVRMMMLTGWCTSGDGTFTWDNAHMRSLYRHLDLCRDEHIQVILTDWGMAKWPKVPGFTGTDDPRYAHAIGEYLDELVVKRRYDCIRSFILVNEPNAETESFERWRDGVRATAAELARRKLDHRIRFLGSDDYAPPYVWHARAISELSDVFGGFDVHRYETQETVRSGGLEAAFRTVSQASRAKDPAKPFLICEAGMSDSMTTSGSPFIKDPVYGLFMADYAVQACRAGCDAMLPWMLDDGSHAGFTWGMWTSKAEGMVLKPWFWT